MAHFHLISIKYVFVWTLCHASVKKKKRHVLCKQHPPVAEYNLKTYSVTMEENIIVVKNQAR